MAITSAAKVKRIPFTGKTSSGLDFNVEKIALSPSNNRVRYNTKQKTLFLPLKRAESLFEEAKELNLRFHSAELVFPETTKIEGPFELLGIRIGKGTTIGAGTSMMQGVRIGSGVVIGDSCNFYLFCKIGSEVTIGNETRLDTRVTIGDQSNVGNKVRFFKGGGSSEVVVGRDVTIGDYVHFRAENITVGDQTTIGKNACIGHTVGEKSTIEPFTETRKEIISGDRLNTIDSPNDDKISPRWFASLALHHSSLDRFRTEQRGAFEKRKNPLLDSKTLPFIFKYLRLCRESPTYYYTEKVSRLLNKNRILLLYLLLHARTFNINKYIQVESQGDKMVVFYKTHGRNEGGFELYHKDEIPSEVIASKIIVTADQAERLEKFNKLIIGLYPLLTKHISEGKAGTPGKFANTDINNLFVMLEEALGKTALSGGRAIDLGGGIGTAARTGRIFFQQFDSIENNNALVRLANKHPIEDDDLRINLFKGNIFGTNLSPYELAFAYIAFPYTGHQDTCPRPIQFNTPWAKKFRKTLSTLKRGKFFISGPVKLGYSVMTRPVVDIVLGDAPFKHHLSLPFGFEMYRKK